MTYLKAAIVIFLSLFLFTVQADQPTNEELDAAWTVEDDARAAAQRIPAPPARVSVDPLGDLADRAELIIHGVVAMQQFVYDRDGTPFTRTTFALIDVLKGDIQGGQFTLVQEGGVERENNDIVMATSNSRHFTIGEEEILLLGPEIGISGKSRGAAFDSDTSIRSTVRYVQTRFRIYNGKVYDEDGRGVFLERLASGGHRLGLSRDRNPAPQFNEIRIGPYTYTKYISGDRGEGVREGPEGHSPTQRAATLSYTESVDAGSLISAIRN